MNKYINLTKAKAALDIAVENSEELPMRHKNAWKIDPRVTRWIVEELLKGARDYKPFTNGKQLRDTLAFLVDYIEER